MPIKNTVLYADDDLDDLQLIKEAFSRYSGNFELVTVPDGIEAISYLNNMPENQPVPCLIILDINMPKMDGKEALKLIREMKRFEKVPAVLFTTSSQEKDKQFATKYNAGFMTKPIEYGELDMIVKQFVERCADETKK